MWKTDLKPLKKIVLKPLKTSCTAHRRTQTHHFTSTHPHEAADEGSVRVVTGALELGGATPREVSDVRPSDARASKPTTLPLSADERVPGAAGPAAMRPPDVRDAVDVSAPTLL
jgi:hypothetical protein